MFLLITRSSKITIKCLGVDCVAVVNDVCMMYVGKRRWWSVVAARGFCRITGGF